MGTQACRSRQSTELTSTVRLFGLGVICGRASLSVLRDRMDLSQVAQQLQPIPCIVKQAIVPNFVLVRVNPVEI